MSEDDTPTGHCPECGATRPNLNLRIIRFMERNGIADIGELLEKKWTIARILREPNMGTATIRDIVYALLALERSKGAQ